MDEWDEDDQLAKQMVLWLLQKGYLRHNSTSSAMNYSLMVLENTYLPREWMVNGIAN